MHRMVLLGDEAQMEARLVTVLVSVQDRCTVYANCTIGSEIILTHRMVLLSDEAQMEARFGPFGYSANHDSR
jgi:serine acetyltransferase